MATAITAIIVCAMAGIAFVLFARRGVRRRHIAIGLLSSLAAAAMLAAAAAGVMLTIGLRGYERLTHETLAAELQFLQESEGKYVASLRLPSGAAKYFTLTGDEWQIDARVIKWHGLATLLGFDAVYRLERLGGRYRDVERERTAERSVYALGEEHTLDAWELTRRYAYWLPGIDALYGSATYLPMADGASYDVMVSQSGLIARPLNDAARRAVAGWR